MNMAFFDLSLEQLETYTPERKEPPDFEQFWIDTLAEARWHPLNATFTRIESPLKLVDVYDVTYNGFGGQPIKGWYIRPHGVKDRLPCIVEFIGYGGGRGYPHEWLSYSIAGYAHFIMDTRGQGSAWRQGDTPDISETNDPSFPGFMTRGIKSPTTYYYRRVFTDAVRAVEAVLSRDDVDQNRIAVTGGSQGGGITLAVAGLLTDQVALCLPDVPFLCHFRRAVGLTDAFPYQEIVNYLRVHRMTDQGVFNTLDYFDGMNFSARITAETLASTSLMDIICPPSTVFAAYNQITAPKSIEVYRFNVHEGGGADHLAVKLRWVAERWG